MQVLPQDWIARMQFSVDGLLPNLQCVHLDTNTQSFLLYEFTFIPH